MCVMLCYLLFFFNDTATTEIYTLSLHDALPICSGRRAKAVTDSCGIVQQRGICFAVEKLRWLGKRSEEHTSELQSRLHLVCRLLLEKKKSITKYLCTLSPLS